MNDCAEEAGANVLTACIEAYLDKDFPNCTEEQRPTLEGCPVEEYVGVRRT